jgi:DNA-binding Lrp family transcriptional regulator
MSAASAQIYRAIVRALQASGALTPRQRVRTREVANRIRQSPEDTLSALKELHSEGVVDKHPSRTDPRRFLIKLVRGVPKRPDFDSDALHILGLSKSNTTAAKIVGNLAIQRLKMSNPQNRRTFNDVVEQLIRAGFDGALGTYEYVAGSYYWWLLPGGARTLTSLIRQRHGVTRRAGKAVRKRLKIRRRKQLPP